MLQSGRALMFLNGYKPTGQYQHIAVIKFVHEVFGAEISDKTIDIFNRLRRKRHRAVYEEADLISEEEAKNAIKWAEEFLIKVKEILEKEEII